LNPDNGHHALLSRSEQVSGKHLGEKKRQGGRKNSVFGTKLETEIILVHEQEERERGGISANCLDHARRLLDLGKGTGSRGEATSEEENR